ncbi:type I polyketide synthase [Amycolatopsis dendrobii]|uniref:Acyltransferase domain-containing protein n=1 Tax=Amycolatopsis dendrobii TaxID=2760662 RepID=A0A7W3VZQ7_9PSEU|nr:type I polyketide synthase [Amycolatopsis dendrobii]MBB1156115.1 acyltransferase domain-containing protein [Amycolatopsis dendrobii]
MTGAGGTFDAGRSVIMVGVACRFPGARNADELWELLISGGDAVGEIPRERFDAEKCYSAESGKPHTIRSLGGGYLNDVDNFDAGFFGITRGEAEQMDPQQRMLMEVVWQAVEDAGLTAEGLAGSNTGVYLSTFGTEYWDFVRAAGRSGLHAAMGTVVPGMIAGRIAHHLDLRGPTMGVAANCATSLLAVHLAVRALRHGEIDLAIVGGAQLMLSPDLHFAVSEAEMLSPTGRSRFGDASADGYVRSEGVGAVILKRLPDATRDRDRGYAAIVGTATGNNGRSGPSLTAPAQVAQESTLRAAYRDAGIPPAAVGYVEAHGPGTPAGDPVELQALADVLGEGRPEDRPCLVGSVKSNIGHLEGVAGIAGLIKTALVLRHRTVPATLHVTKPIAQFRQPGTPLRLPRRTQVLPAEGQTAIAGVTSLGLAGAIVHVVLAELPERGRADPQERSAYLLPLSARHPEALRQTAQRYAGLLESPAAPALADVCHTAAVRRTHFERRMAVVGSDREELVAALAAAGRRQGSAQVFGDGSPVTEPPKIVFVYPGQGSQWPGMARELLASSEVFARRFAECDRAVRHETGWSPAEVIGSGAEVSTMDFVQPVLWSVQVALAAVWRDFGVEPDLVIGHSMGEVAAAVTAGALSVSDGAAVICRRSALLAARRTPGAMWAVQLGEQAAQRAIGEYADRVCVGVVNSRAATVLSGDPDALAEIVAGLRADGVFCRQVRVDYASHAPQVEPLRPLLHDVLAGLRPRPGRVPVRSTVLDSVVDGSGFDAGYWADNLILPVRFESAVRAVLADRRPTVFVEISPHPILSLAIEDGIQDAAARAWQVASLRRDEPEYKTMLGGLGAVYAAGGEVAFDRLGDGRFVDVPGYPWQHERFWIDAGEVEWPGGTGAAPRATPIDALHYAESAATVPGRVRYLRTAVGLLLGLPDVDPAVPLPALGLSSVFAVQLAYQVRTELGLRVSGRDLLGAASIEDLARELEPRPREAVS